MEQAESIGITTRVTGLREKTMNSKTRDDRNSGSPACSSPAVPLSDLSACCVAAIKRGQKVITYKCDGCGRLRQLDVDRPKEYSRQEVVCDCGHQQPIHLFA